MKNAYSSPSSDLTPTALPAFADLPATAMRDHAEALDLALRVIAEQQRRIAELENEAHSDSATGLLNTRGFRKALDRECERALRAGTASTLLVLFDLDGLKQVNDRFGHLAGDAYIAGLADALKDAVRTTDYIARLGGDEFALLLTDVDIAKGWQRVAHIVERLNQRLIRYNNRRFTLRVSHGAAVVAPGESAETLIAEADLRLYERKAERKKDMAS